MLRLTEYLSRSQVRRLARAEGFGDCGSFAYFPKLKFIIVQTIIFVNFIIAKIKKMDVSKTMQDLERVHPGKTEFLQAVREVLDSISYVVDRNPQLKKPVLLKGLQNLTGCFHLKCHGLMTSAMFTSTGGIVCSLIMPWGHTKEGFAFTPVST
jgi:hypothetical protein